MRHAPYSTFSEATPLDAASVAGPVSLTRIVLGKLRWLVALPGRIAAIRRDMALLGRMSAGELADIGLMRQDLWDATALPLGRAPDTLFQARADERRRAAKGRKRRSG